MEKCCLRHALEKLVDICLKKLVLWVVFLKDDRIIGKTGIFFKYLQKEIVYWVEIGSIKVGVNKQLKKTERKELILILSKFEKIGMNPTVEIVEKWNNFIIKNEDHLMSIGINDIKLSTRAFYTLIRGIKSEPTYDLTAFDIVSRMLTELKENGNEYTLRINGLGSQSLKEVVEKLKKMDCLP
jgi:hypothetical protein